MIPTPIYTNSNNMHQLEDQIEFYADDHFDPSHTAQHFFASFGEAEISKKRADMTKIQLQIENVLKQNVRNKYTDFLIATEQINQVGNEMLELKQLIENTQKLVEDARAVKQSTDFKTFKHSNLVPKDPVNRNNPTQKRLEEIQQERRAAAADASVPSWLIRAADDVAQYIVEQQYQKAVAVVIKTRSYVDGLLKLKGMQNNDISSPGNNFNPTTNEKALIALAFVNERAIHLAAAIKRSLSLIPNSPLWGMQELFKRLKLLIALSEYKLAAEGFAQIKEQSIQRAIFSVEITSDTYYYCQALSKVFYQELAAAIITYYQLFDDQRDNMEITSLLLQWIQTQISVYVQMLVRQITFAVNDATTVLIVHLKDSNSYTKFNNALHPAQSPVNRLVESAKSTAITANNNSTTTGGDGGDAPKKKRILFRAESTMSVDKGMSSSNLEIQLPEETTEDNSRSRSPTNPRSLLRSSMSNPKSNSSTTSVTSTSNSSVLTSGIPLLIKCLRSLFTAAIEYQSDASRNTSESNSTPASTTISSSERRAKAAPVYPVLIYFLMPQIKSLLYAYTDDLCKEISSQVRQDAWNFLKAPMLTVRGTVVTEVSNTMTRLNTALNPDNNAGESENEKLVSLSYIWITAVMNIFTEDTYHLLNSVKSDQFNLRNDFSEIEPVTATCLLRLLLRYIVEIEAVDFTTLARVQQECYHSTIEAMIYYFIPSLQKLMEDYFLLERLALLSNPPNVIFKTVIMRLFRILNDVDTSLANSKSATTNMD